MQFFPIWIGSSTNCEEVVFIFTILEFVVMLEVGNGNRKFALKREQIHRYGFSWIGCTFLVVMPRNEQISTTFITTSFLLLDKLFLFPV